LGEEKDVFTLGVFGLNCGSTFYFASFFELFLNFRGKYFSVEEGEVERQWSEEEICWAASSFTIMSPLTGLQ
jgi:hypothetical protein